MQSKKMSFLANKINIFLLNFYHASVSARNSMTYRTKYADPSAYWQFQHLERKGYIIHIKTKQGKHFWKLTTRGLKFAELLSFGLDKKPKWDKRWRVLIFDVSKDRNKTRDFLRRKLKELGFYRLQQSVWVTPYPIPESFADFLKNYKLVKNVRCLVVEEINFDEELRKHFGL